jgi:REP element-mobilizing transposase RayT
MNEQALRQNREYKGGLKRLDDSLYRRHSYVHWTMSVKGRASGWLNAEHHDLLRQICLHAMARGFMCCPVYCLMPDHGHFLFVGYDSRTDQRLAVRWFRREWNRILKPHALQHQPYDSVLREKDRSREGFADMVGYILRNPLRAGLVQKWQDWPYSGAIFPGYPHLDPRKPLFWDDFWKALLRHSGGRG